MADPVISEIKYLGNGDQDTLEVRVPDDYPDPQNLRLVIYDRGHDGSTTAVPSASDIYDITTVGKLYTEDVDNDGNDDDGVLHYTIGTSENGTTIFLHAEDAVGLYNVVTGETYGLYNWTGSPYTVSTATNDPFAGQVATQLDPTGQIRDVTSLSRDENGDYNVNSSPTPGSSYICFTSGTQIKTPYGNRFVEDLRIGDIVVTKDHGVQPIRWIGSRHFAPDECIAPNAQPIVIKAHAFGPGVPAYDTRLSPNHAILNTHWKATLYFGETEVLTAAKGLLDTGYAYRATVQTITYFHILLDQHSLVMANGLWSESLYLGSQCMEMLSPCNRAEVGHLFPDLSSYGQTVRHQIKPKEAALLM